MSANPRRLTTASGNPDRRAPLVSRFSVRRTARSARARARRRAVSARA